MWRYLKSAFLVGVDTPGLGRLPINVLIASAFAILGFAEPALWLIGLAGETAFVSALAFNPRFQKYVQAQQVQSNKLDDDSRRRALVQMLEPDARRRLSDLADKCERVISVYQSQQAEDYIIDSNQDALRNLQWVYLKLLVARHHLLSPASNESEDTLRKKVAALEHEVQESDQPDSLRQSRSATLSILKKRLGNFQRREQTLEEIESDLTRIEAQVDLVLENATMQGKPQTITTDIELASDLIGVGAFGDDESAITALDRKYSAHKSAQTET